MSNEILNALPSTLRTDTHDILTEYFDLRAKRLIQEIEAFINFAGDYNKFSESKINSIAPFFGFSTESFWSTSWSKSTKSRLLKGVYRDPFIWQHNGQKPVLDYVISCFDLNAQLVRDEGFIVDLDVVDVKILSVGNTYNLEVKNLTFSTEQLCKRIVQTFVPVGIIVNILSV